MYAEPGTYTVSITGDFQRIRLHDDSNNAAKLVSIDSWGDNQWKTMDHAFSRTTNMVYNATDVPDFSALTDLQFMFYTSSFDGDVSGWNISSVTNMKDMFAHADSFDGDVSGWDVSNVRSMFGMFYHADSFDGDVSGWDVSSVTSMGGMFTFAGSFDGDVSGWDVSSVTDMNRMFFGTPLLQR